MRRHVVLTPFAAFAVGVVCAAAVTFPRAALGSNNRTYSGSGCFVAEGTETLAFAQNTSPGYGNVLNKGSFELGLLCPMVNDYYINLASATNLPSVIVSGTRNGATVSANVQACIAYHSGGTPGGSCGTVQDVTGSVGNFDQGSIDVSSWTGGATSDGYIVVVGLTAATSGKYSALHNVNITGGS